MAACFARSPRPSRNGLSGPAIARLEGRHRAAGGNALRAAVLGVNDGLVSNLSLIMGVAGASLQQTTILLTGLAGLLAGAISMALGKWLSVQSSRELYARQVAIERVAKPPELAVQSGDLSYQLRTRSARSVFHRLGRPSPSSSVKWTLPGCVFSSSHVPSGCCLDLST
jgi:vacuolar iron transporter family protein